MHSFQILTLLTALAVSAVGQESEAVAFFQRAGARITTDKAGHAIKVFSSGKPEHSVTELQRLGELPHLEELALNAATGGDGDWGFLAKLPKLKQLTLWHCKTISSLKPFNDLPIEGLTVGGCMGIRDLNRNNPAKQRDVVLSLRGLPRLKRLNLYHSPLAPDDTHLAHLISEFPLLEDLKLDFGAPRGSATAITPAGLRALKVLPLKVLSMEGVDSFSADHLRAIGEIKSLAVVLIDARRSPDDVTPLVDALKAVRPDLEIVAAEKGAKAPPTPARRKR